MMLTSDHGRSKSIHLCEHTALENMHAPPGGCEGALLAVRCIMVTKKGHSKGSAAAEQQGHL